MYLIGEVTSAIMENLLTVTRMLKTAATMDGWRAAGQGEKVCVERGLRG